MVAPCDALNARLERGKKSIELIEPYMRKNIFKADTVMTLSS